MANTLKFGNGTWATKKGSTLAYNDENDRFKPLPFTTTRASSATRVNKEGLIEVVSNDIPRIDYTDSADGALLLENSATNVIINSEDFTGSEWGLSGVASGDAPILTSNYATSPDGKQNATRLQFNLNGGTTTTDRSYIRYTSFSSQTDYYYSCYVKSANGQEQKLLWHHGGDDSEFTVTNEWQRVELDRNGNAETFAGFSLRGGISTVDYSDVLIWGFQVESNSYPTSYIPTNGSAVTRVADTASGAGNSEVFNDSEGVLFADISANSSDVAISLSDNTFNNSISFGVYLNKISAVIRKDGGYITSGIIDNSGNAFNNNKIAIKYNSSSCDFYINGFVIGTSSGVTYNSNVLDNLNFNRGSANDNFYGTTKEIGYYDTALTDEELEYITSYRSLNELVTELNLNTL